MDEINKADESEMGRNVLTKVSWHILPLIFFGYGIAYMDRVNVGFAALRMNRDLNFSATVYGLGAGLFFLTYALFEIPSNLLLMKFGARRWIARIMLTWGVVASAMMFVKTPGQFYALRLLLGVAEAGFFPGVIFYLTQWFPRDHRGRTISYFYFAGPLGATLTGALASTLLNLDGRLGLNGWQWLFLLQGLPAIILGFVVLAFLRDQPAHASWLSVAERDWLVSRLQAEHAWKSTLTTVPLSKIATDTRLWRLCLSNVMIMGSNYTLSLSAPLLLRSALKWEAGRIGAVVAITGIASALAMIINGRISDIWRSRYSPTVLPIGVFALAALTMSIWPSEPTILCCYVICTVMAWAAQAVYWLIPSDVMHGRSAAVGIAAIGSIGMLGAFLGPYGWGIARDLTGGYQVGLAGLAVAYAIAFALLFSLGRTSTALAAIASSA